MWTHHETFWVLYRELLLMNVSKAVWGIVLVLPWFRIIGKTMKTLGFYNNTHLRDQSSLDVSSRGVFWALLNFYDGTFGKSIKGLLAVNYFRKTLHFRYLRGLPVCLCHLWHKFSICILNQMKREHIPINVLLNP